MVRSSLSLVFVVFFPLSFQWCVFLFSAVDLLFFFSFRFALLARRFCAVGLVRLLLKILFLRTWDRCLDVLLLLRLGLDAVGGDYVRALLRLCLLSLFRFFPQLNVECLFPCGLGYCCCWLSSLDLCRVFTTQPLSFLLAVFRLKSLSLERNKRRY